MNGIYLLFLLVAIFCLGLIDKRYTLVVFKNKRLAFKVIGISAAFFIIWDLAGILLDIFFIGTNELLLGIRIGEFPVEELFFLILLNYSALIISQFIKLQRNIK